METNFNFIIIHAFIQFYDEVHKLLKLATLTYTVKKTVYGILYRYPKKDGIRYMTVGSVKVYHTQKTCVSTIVKSTVKLS